MTTTRKVAVFAIFVLIVAGIIGAGAWYSSSHSESSSGSTTQQTNSSPSTTMQNLQITDITVGTGTVAQAGDTVTVNYVGTFDDGTKFDSSYDRNQPFTFLLGAQQVIAGWDQGIVGMKVGGKRQLVIPPDLAYGPAGRPGIPPNATLHFTVELLKVSASSSAQ